MKDLLMGSILWVVIVIMGLIIAESQGIAKHDGIIVIALAYLVINQKHLD